MTSIPPPGRDRVEQLVHDPLDASRHRLDGAGRERLVHQPPQTGVVRRVRLEHRPRLLLEEPAEALVRQPLARAAGAVGGQPQVA